MVSLMHIQRTFSIFYCLVGYRTRDAYIMILLRSASKKSTAYENLCSHALLPRFDDALTVLPVEKEESDEYILSQKQNEINFHFLHAIASIERINVDFGDN